MIYRKNISQQTILILLTLLEMLKIKRRVVPLTFSCSQSIELCVYNQCDDYNNNGSDNNPNKDNNENKDKITIKSY